MTNPKDDLLKELKKADAFPLIVTGAGISAASGIPTFRGNDPDAVWANDVMEMGTFQFFCQDPVTQWKWYLKRFSGCTGAKPNAAHTALVDIEKKLLSLQSNFHIITQNIDGLHIDAGSQNITEVHGAARKLRCSSENCDNGAPNGFIDWSDDFFVEFQKDPTYNNLPRCTKCNGILRAHVLWFDEGYYDHNDYGMEKLDTIITDVSSDVTSLIFIGTSLSVGITYFLIIAALKNGIPMFIIDPYMKESPLPEHIELIKEPSETFLPELVKAL